MGQMGLESLPLSLEDTRASYRALDAKIRLLESREHITPSSCLGPAATEPENALYELTGNAAPASPRPRLAPPAAITPPPNDSDIRRWQQNRRLADLLKTCA